MSAIQSFHRSTCPYPGLRPYLQGESDIFFGREEQVDEILEKLGSHRFLALVGTSGCGKSSLARAGVTSALETGLMTKAGFRWRVATMRPGEQPLSNLVDAILQPGVLGPNQYAGASPGRGTVTSEAEEARIRDGIRPFVLASLRRGPLGLTEVLCESLIPGTGPALPEKENLLLVVDQFEEIFRFAREIDRNEADAFVATLLATVRADLPVYVVLTMRSDYLGDCAIFQGLPEMLNDSQYLTPRLSWEQRRAAIEGPARVCGDTVEPALVGRLMNDMGAEPDELPLMQHVLMRLWKRADEADKASGSASTAGGRVLRLQDYESLGGLKNCLDKHAEEVYATLGETQKPIAEILFRALSERDVSRAQASHRDTRRPTKLGDIARVADCADEAVATLVDIYRAEGINFLTMTSEKLLDVSHESLIRRWRRLQEWVTEEAKSAEIYRRLLDRAQMKSRGETDQYLDKLQLGFALNWKKEQKPTAAWAKRYGGDFALAMAFLQESEQAENERAAAERENRKRQQRNKVIGWAAGVGLILSMVSLLFAWWGFRSAAQAQEKKAEAERAVEKYRVENKKFLTEKQHRQILDIIATAEKSQITPQQSLLLGVEAFKHVSAAGMSENTARTAEDTLRKTLANIGGRGYSTNQGKITQLAVSENSKGAMTWVATASEEDGSLVLWNMKRKPAEVKPMTLDFGFHAKLTWLKITGDGRWLIAQSGAANLLTLWDLESPELDCSVLHGYGNPQLSPSGNWLLTHGVVQEANRSHGKAKLVDLRQKKPFSQAVEISFEPVAFITKQVAFSKYDQWIALQGDAPGPGGVGIVCLGNLKDMPLGGMFKLARLKAPLASPIGLAANGRSVAFNEGSNKLVAYMSNGTVRQWEETPEGWNGPATEVALKTSFKDKEGVLLAVNVATDAQGLLAVVAKRTSFGSASQLKTTADFQSAFSDASSTLNALPGQLVDEKAVAYLFDDRHSEFPNAKYHLKGYDESIDWDRPFQLDEAKTWLLAFCKGKTQGLRIWNLRDINKVKLPVSIVPPEGVQRAVLSSNGRWLVTSSGPENFVRLWDLWAPGYSSSPVILRGHDGAVSTFALSEDNNWLVTGGADGTLRTWDLTSLTPSAEPTIFRNRSAQRTLVVTSDRRWLAFSDSKGAVRVWDLADADYKREPHHTLPCFNKNQFASLQLSGDGRFLAAFGRSEAGGVAALLGLSAALAGEDKAVLWKLDGEFKQRYCELHGLAGRVVHFSVSPDGRWIVAELEQVRASSPKSSVQVWRLSENNVAESVQLPISQEYTWGFVASGNYLLTDTDYRFRMWDLSSEKVKEIEFPLDGSKTFKTGETQIQVAPRGRHLVILLNEETAKSVDLTASAAGKYTERSLEGLNRIYFFGPNGRWLVGAKIAKKGEIPAQTLFWDLQSSEPKVRPTSEENRTRSFFTTSWSPISSPDRRWIVTSDQHGASYLVDLNAQDARLFKRNLPKNTSWVEFSPDSAWMVNIVDGFIEVSNLALPDAAPVARLKDNYFQGMLRRAAVSRAGKALAILGADNLIRVLELDRDREVRLALLSNGPVSFQPTGISLSANGRRVISVDESNNTIRISRVPIDELLRIAERTVGRNLSRAEWKDSRLPGDYRPTFGSFGERQDAPARNSLPEYVGPSAEQRAKKRGIVLDVQAALTATDPIDPFRNSRSKIYSTRLQAGRTYVIDMKSTEFDSFLRLESLDGVRLAEDDDGGGYPNARIEFDCKKDGEYKIIATCFDNKKLGRFMLFAQEKSSIPEHAKLLLSYGAVERQDKLGPDDFEDTQWSNCPSKVYGVRLEAGKVCQIELRADAFDAYVRLENADGKPLESGDNVGQTNSRIVFGCRETAVYRLVAVSRNGVPGDFTLTLRTR